MNRVIIRIFASVISFSLMEPLRFTLYHGTDARILSMSKEERSSFLTDIDIALDYLWTIWEPLIQKTMIRELRWPNGEFKGTVPISFLESRKQQFIDAGQEILYKNLYEKVSMFSWTKEGAELYQYGALYVTMSKKTAADFARRSFAGGERGLIVYRMLEGIAFLGIPLGNPDKRTTDAIQRVKAFADANDAAPVIVTLKDVAPCDLLTESGKPADAMLQLVLDSGILIEPSFRYVKEIELSLFPMEQLHLSEQR